MYGPIQTAVNETHKLEIFHDTSPDSPREWTNLFTIETWTREYLSPDKDGDYSSQDAFRTAVDGTWALIDDEGDVWDTFYTEAEAKEYRRVQLGRHYSRTYLVQRDEEPTADMAHYAYLVRNGRDGELSTLDASDDPMAYPVVGVAYVTRERALKTVQADTLDKLPTYLAGELDTYNQWSRGEVYGFVLSERVNLHVVKTDVDGTTVYEGDEIEWDEIDACSGFYGTDHRENGMMGYLSSACQTMFDLLS